MAYKPKYPIKAEHVYCATEGFFELWDQRHDLVQELKRLINSISIHTTTDIVYQKVAPIELIASDLESAEKLIQQIEGKEDGRK